MPPVTTPDLGLPRRRHVLVPLGLLVASPRVWANPAAAAPAAPGPATAAARLQDRVAQEGVGLVAVQVQPGAADGAGSASAASSGPASALSSGAALWLAAAGARAAGSADPPDGDTRFEWGSITKTFTALLLADAVHRRELALDDAVEDALPTGTRLRDRAGDPIRWLDLATHRSGLPRLPDNLQPARPADPYADYDAAALATFLARWRPEHPRGRHFDYSNLGFGLLGHALGLRLGRGLAAALAERVLQPLGLPGVRLRQPGVVVPAVAQGHDAAGQPVPPWHFDVLAGAGALTGSARELGRYTQAALGLVDTPLAPAFRLALSRHADGPSAGVGVGLGWLLGTVAGRPWAQHDGATHGFSSALVLDLQRRRGAAVLANAAVPVTDVAVHLLEPAAPLRNPAAERAAAQAAAQQPVAALAPGQLQPLAGVYALNPQFAVTVRVRDGRLWAQATGQGEFELFARTPRQFFARVTPLEVHFDGPDGGAPAAFTLLQGGQRLRFVRQADPPR